MEFKHHVNDLINYAGVMMPPENLRRAGSDTVSKGRVESPWPSPHLVLSIYSIWLFPTYILDNKPGM